MSDVYRSQDHNPHSFLVKEGDQEFVVEQNIEGYLIEAERSRTQQWDNRHSLRKSHWRPFCNLPDIVAIDILKRYNLNVHDPEFANIPGNGAKLKDIIRKDYAYLLLSHGV
jgi:hypothetical protein